jgi:hypothetical protein
MSPQNYTYLTYLFWLPLAHGLTAIVALGMPECDHEASKMRRPASSLVAFKLNGNQIRASEVQLYSLLYG